MFIIFSKPSIGKRQCYLQ